MSDWINPERKVTWHRSWCTPCGRTIASGEAMVFAYRAGIRNPHYAFQGICYECAEKDVQLRDVIGPKMAANYRD